jgi:transmembrane sensor
MSRKRILDAEVLCKYLQGETSEEENSVLLKWVNQSKTNEKLFLEMKYIWETSRSGGLLAEIEKNREWEKFLSKIQSANISRVTEKNAKIRSVFAAIVKIAAVFIMAFVIAWFVLKPKEKPAENPLSYYEFRTPKGARSEVQLPDGSKVWLNSTSFVRFPNNFSGNNRKIYLEGEAYFDVKKNESYPMVISTSDINIKVIGTAFNVKSYPGEGTIETTLERGTITLEKKASNSEEKNSIITLQPNQRVTFVKKQGKISLDEIRPVNTVDSATKKLIRQEKIIVSQRVETEKYTAWKDGKIIFDNETFENLSVKLERWFDIKIHIEDESLKKIRFTGTFEKETIEQVLNIMRLTTPIKYTMNKNDIYITMKPN